MFRKEKPHKKYRKYHNLLSAVVLYMEPEVYQPKFQEEEITT